MYNRTIALKRLVDAISIVETFSYNTERNEHYNPQKKHPLALTRVPACCIITIPITLTKDSNMSKEQFISPASRRNRSDTPTPFSTVHMRLHSDIHALLKQEAISNNRSIPATLEMILYERYANRLHVKDKVRSELGDFDFE